MRASTSILAGTVATLALHDTPAWSRGGGESAKLLPDDNQPLDVFGDAVALDGALALVGARGDSDIDSWAGAAYLYDARTGLLLFELHAADADQGARFGTSVAVSGTTAFVGAPGSGPTGAVYLFDASSGSQLAKLVALDADTGASFGMAIDIHGSSVIVGAPDQDEIGNSSGAAYVFDAVTGQQIVKLLPNDGAHLDRFGFSVALHGSTAVVGAIGDDDGGPGAGSAYLFALPSGQQIAKLLASQPNTQFGRDVAIEGTTVLVGMPGDDDYGPDSGSVYVFDAGTGQQIAKLLPNDPYPGDEFGASVDLEGGFAVLGAPGDNQGDWSTGAAYLFDPSTWQQVAKLVATDGLGGDQLGSAVAISGATVLAGAPYSDDPPYDSGSAYLFDVSQGIALPYCFGAQDPNSCPCANAGQRGHGCANSAFPEGARLWADRAPCVSEDHLILRAWHSPPHQPGLFFQGDDALNGGLGLPFGDGLRCAGTNVLRLEVDAANASGLSFTTLPIAATAGIVAGDVKRYQWWYRDPVGGPCGAGFNLSNGLEVTWAP